MTGLASFVLKYSRGQAYAGSRIILDARGKYGLVHNIGLGGAVVLSLLRRPEFYHFDGPDGRNR